MKTEFTKCNIQTVNFYVSFSSRESKMKIMDLLSPNLDFVLNVEKTET